MKKALLLGGGLLLALLVWHWTVASSATVTATAAASSAPGVQVPQTSGAAVTNLPGLGPVPADPKTIEKLKAKLKREMQASFRAVGVFSSREDQKLAQDTGELAWIYLEKHKDLPLALRHILDSVVEPYPPRILEALEHLLKHGTDAQMKVTAATLLYRYDQAAGKQYLLSVLNNPETDRLLARDVALVLARNKEREAGASIAAVFPKLGATTTELLLAMGQWRDSSISEVLRQESLRYPLRWSYSIAMSQEGSISSVELITKRLAQEKRPGGEVVHNLEATLARNGSLDPSVWQQHLSDAFRKQPDSLSRTVLTSFAIAGSQVGGKYLQQMLASTIPLHEAYLDGMELHAKGIREKIPELANKFPKPSPYEFIMGAAQLLAQWEAKEAVPTLQQVLTTVQKGNRADVYVNEALGLALYKLDPVNWRDTLLSAGIPPYHVDRIPELAKLRPIPAEYLPKQVNLKAR